MNRRAGLTLVFALATVLAGAGCDTYSYFEIDTQLDPLTITTENAFQISTCRVTVSGAATDTFYITKRCPPPSGVFDIGVFEYSTFADSGELTFTVAAFRFGEMNQVGEGKVTLPVSSGRTAMGMVKVVGTPAP